MKKAIILLCTLAAIILSSCGSNWTVTNNSATYFPDTSLSPDTTLSNISIDRLPDGNYDVFIYVDDVEIIDNCVILDADLWEGTADGEYDQWDLVTLEMTYGATITFLNWERAIEYGEITALSFPELLYQYAGDYDLVYAKLTSIDGCIIECAVQYPQ